LLVDGDKGLKTKPDPLPASPLKKGGRKATANHAPTITQPTITPTKHQASQPRLKTLRPTFFPVFVLKIRIKGWPQRFFCMSN
jgi:hypothetical protein